MALALDGQSSQVNNSTGTVNLTLTTSNGSGIVYVSIISNDSVTSVTSANVTYSRRKQTNAGSDWAETWYGVYNSNLSSESITITMNSATFTTAIAIGISGCNTSSPFDSNASVPATCSSAQASINTSNANDFVIVNYLLFSASDTAGSIYTLLASSNFQLAEYKIVSATQSGLLGTMGSGDADVPNVGIMDAIVAAAVTLPFANTQSLLWM